MLPSLLVGGLLLFHAINNWIWLVENITWTGWDKPRHLANSLNYTQMLTSFSIRSLFEMMVNDPIRPPLFPASAAIVYWLFGRTADVATMINVLYMAIALAATLGIGQRWGGRRLGLLSALLLACFPMFYAMSRYFYLEFALTAMVSLAVYLLLATDGFQRRGVSLLFGLSLGLGLLTKRTFAVFVVGPVLVAILASGLLPMLWQRLRRRPRLYWKKALLALAGGLALAALWYLPNREMVRTLVLGDFLFFLWWALAALAIYFAALPSAPLSNALASVFLAAGLASTWYLARVEFLQRMALYGYGVNDPRGRTLQLDRLDTYLFYLRKLGNEHVSFLLFAILVVVLLAALVVYLRRHRSLGQALRQLRPEAWVVVAWLAGAYVLLSLSIYHETRAFTPVLPAVALLFGAALLKLPWRPVRLGVLAAVVLFALLQFFSLTYEPVSRLLPPGTFDLPLWGQATSFAQGDYIQLPDEGETDRSYWIHPDVLERMELDRQVLGQEILSLGLLANTTHYNAGPFNYLMLTEYPHLRVASLIDRFDETSPYRRLFAYDYILVKRANENMNPSQEKTIQAILDGPPLLFAQAFELVSSYSLPDGETVYLYRQRYHLPAGYPVEYVTGLAEKLGARTRTGDALLLEPLTLVGPFVAHYTGPAAIYLAPQVEEEMAGLTMQHRRIFLVQGDAAAGEVQDLAWKWLDQHGFPAAHEWSDSLQLLTYGTVAGSPATTLAVEVHEILGGQVELVGYDLPAGNWHPGDIVPLTFFWQAQTAIGQDYNVFVHLLDTGGRLVSQTDSMPVGGSQPTSSWDANDFIVDRHGLPLPDDLAPGEYALYTGMYLPAAGERLITASGQDAILLSYLTVEGP